VSAVDVERPISPVQQRPALLARAGAAVRAYVALTKPRIVELLLITAVPTLFLADKGLPSVMVTFVVVVGGALAAGSANALNCYIDRDVDQLMRRTRTRPLVSHTVSARAALVFGVVIGVISVALFAATTNLLAAALTLGAILYYVFVYTLLLKRHTSQSTLWGGICGAAPVLIAWAATTGTLSWAAAGLFGVVFLWQPPHFWALAIKYRDDYRSAGIPMLPVVAPVRQVLAHSIVYSWLMVAVSLAVWPFAGPVYGAAAVLLGGVFLYEVHRLYHQSRGAHGEEVVTMRLFHLSITYLTLLFVAVAVGAFVR
jgi:protoheme IX farnesyltransferase